jgi:hypothetical protein
MRKTLQRRPGFEALESMTLLSGLAGVAVSTAAPHPIHLTGSIEIKLPGAHPAEKGSGSISPLGHVTESGDGMFFSGWADSETLTLKAKTGKVFVFMNGVKGEYTITGGTKAYAGATGSGNVQITELNTPTLKFTARFS